MSFFAADEVEIARQLTIRSYELFSAIRVRSSLEPLAFENIFLVSYNSLCGCFVVIRVLWPTMEQTIDSTPCSKSHPFH